MKTAINTVSTEVNRAKDIIIFKNRTFEYSIKCKEFFDYLLSTLPEEDHDGNELKTEVEKLTFLAQRFKAEYIHANNLKRYRNNYARIFKEWAQGLAFDVLYTYYDIENLFKSLENENKYFDNLCEEDQELREEENSLDEDEVYYNTDPERGNEEDEEEPILHIQGQVENIKSISLSGAEIESLVVEPADDLDEISDLEDDDDKKEIITLEETSDEQPEDLVESVENNETEEEEIIDEESVYVKKIEVGDVKPLDKMTVKELRNKAEKDGFTNFKGLRKDKLVELLTSQ